MTVLTNRVRAGGFIQSESNLHRSRDQVTIKSGAGVLLAGTVLGKLAADGAFSAVFAARSGNTGNGVLTLAGPATGAGVKVGIYTVVCTAAVANSGKFRVEDPDGIEIGEAVVGSAFTNEVKFTIADGATDFVVSDGFDITVSEAAASGKYVAAVDSATDGSQTGLAILFDDVDATAADVIAAVIARDAEVRASDLTFDASVSDDGKKATKYSQLATRGIIVRT